MDVTLTQRSEAMEFFELLRLGLSGFLAWFAAFLGLLAGSLNGAPV